MTSIQYINNSSLLIDNGNSGFVGTLTYNFVNTWAPWIDNTYSIYGLLLLTVIFFSISADISYKKVLNMIFSLLKENLLRIFKMILIRWILKINLKH